MIVIKTPREISLMQEAGKVSSRALKLAGEAVEPGVTTQEIDSIVRNYIESQGATPSFLDYRGFPGSACISVNEEVIHGIPSKRRVLKNGDIVSIDVGAYLDGFHGDNAWTFECGEVSRDAKLLLETTKNSLFEAINIAKMGSRVGDIGNCIQNYVETKGYSVVTKFVGHGVGAVLHEDPSVPNYGESGRGPRLINGMTIAIEPMINMGSGDVRVLKDGWTTVTADGSLSAHFEHSIAITDDGPKILTNPD